MAVADRETTTPLAYYGWIMEESGFEVVLGQPDGLELEELLVIFARNKEGKPLINILLSFAEDLVEAMFKRENKPFEARPGTNLQLLCKLPFKVNPVHLKELKILAARVNEELPMGSFLVTEKEGVAFRYNYLGIHQRQIEPRLLVRVVSQIGTLAKKYLPHFGSLNKGKKSLSEVIHDLGGQA